MQTQKPHSSDWVILFKAIRLFKIQILYFANFILYSCQVRRFSWINQPKYLVLEASPQSFRAHTNAISEEEFMWQ